MSTVAGRNEVRLMQSLPHHPGLVALEAVMDGCVCQGSDDRRRPLQASGSDRPCTLILEYVAGGTVAERLYPSVGTGANRGISSPAPDRVRPAGSEVAMWSPAEDRGDASGPSMLPAAHVDTEANTGSVPLSGTPLPTELALTWMGQLARTLAFLHEHSVVHRDVKAANVFVLPGDHVVKLGDFGAAAVTMQHGKDGALRTVIGTPHYMSPEMCEERPYGPPTDVWSLGVLSFEMLNGYLPFEAANLLALVMTITESPPAEFLSRPVRRKPPVDAGGGGDQEVAVLPRYVKALVLSMLNKDANQRPTAAQIAKSITAALRRYRTGRQDDDDDNDEGRDDIRKAVALPPAAPHPLPQSFYPAGGVAALPGYIQDPATLDRGTFGIGRRDADGLAAATTTGLESEGGGGGPADHHDLDVRAELQRMYAENRRAIDLAYPDSARGAGADTGRQAAERMVAADDIPAAVPSSNGGINSAPSRESPLEATGSLAPGAEKTVLTAVVSEANPSTHQIGGTLPRLPASAPPRRAPPKGDGLPALAKATAATGDASTVRHDIGRRDEAAPSSGNRFAAHDATNNSESGSRRHAAAFSREVSSQTDRLCIGAMSSGADASTDLRSKLRENRNVSCQTDPPVVAQVSTQAGATPETGSGCCRVM